MFCWKDGLLPNLEPVVPVLAGMFILVMLNHHSYNNYSCKEAALILLHLWQKNVQSNAGTDANKWF